MTLWNIVLYDLIKHYVYLLTSSAAGKPRAAKTKWKYSNIQKMILSFMNLILHAVCFSQCISQEANENFVC